MTFDLIRPEPITAGMVTTNVAMTEAAWAALTTYADAAIVRRLKDDIWHRFESLHGTNLGNDPALDVAEDHWVDLGAVNAFKMFDNAVQSQTENAETITVSIAFDGGVLLDTLWLDNLDAATLDVTITDAVDGVVREASFDLISLSGITDFYGWCFEPISRLKSVLLQDLPPYPGVTLDVVLSDPGAVAKCGLVTPGLAKSLGTTQWGVRIGIDDYSRKEVNELGNFVVVERAFSKTMNAVINVAADFTDELAETLAAYRATPALWVASGQYTSTAIWGFFASFDEEIAYPDLTLCSLEIKGLT